MRKGLIVRKEWLDKIFDEDKDWEMRSRPNKIYGQIDLIEAGSGFIVGECFIHGSLPPIKTDEEARATYKHHRVDDIKLLKKWCHPWPISNPERLDKPIPYTHPPGAVIWVNLPDNLFP